MTHTASNVQTFTTGLYHAAFSTDQSGLMTDANDSFGAVAAMASDFPENEAFGRFRKMVQGTKVAVRYYNRLFC